MDLHDVWQLNFNFFSEKTVCVEPIEEDISTDGGLLIFRQWDEQLGFTQGFADQLDEPRRSPDHSILEMVRSRVFGIIAGYEDQNDHDALRSDAVFKLLADRSPDDDHLASQPTLSRFENTVTPRQLLRLEEWFVDRFVNSFDEPPQEITLDIDVFDDPTHREQQLTFFHGYYNQYQYMVRAITCAENDMVVLPALLYGTADVALGVGKELQRIANALREKFPHVLIRVRADSGYAKPWLYRLCERLDIEYSIGIGMNNVLKRKSEGENRNKELKCELGTDRLSDHRYMANCFRMFLHCLANNLLVLLRRQVAAPPPEETPSSTDEFSSDTEPQDYLPGEARTGQARRREFNRRRKADPLGEGHASTWRMRLIKVAARIKVTARRVRIFLSGSWPFLDHFGEVGEAVVAPS